MGLLVRPRAWWFNKIPLSVMLLLLLFDGGRLDLAAMLVLILVVLAICAVGNYGYALNELYDVEEDARAGRSNAAAILGQRRTAAIVVGSALLAELLASAVAGWRGAALTTAAMTATFLYSVPPFRIKERKWLGVVADALAAHVYPAALALVAVSAFAPHRVPASLAACVVLWSAATGLRGILSHQLQTAERDRQGGLSTIVHDLGAPTLERLIVWVLLPLEAVAFITAVAFADGGPVLWTLGMAYLACEAFRTLHGGFTVTALRTGGQPYLPFVEESFYKAWGPLVIALDASRADWRFLLLVPAYALLFRPHLRNEAARLRAIAHAALPLIRAG